jgi:hypothetical protein
MRDSALILLIVAAILSCDGQGQGAVVNLVHERIATLNDAATYPAIDRAPTPNQMQILHAHIFLHVGCIKILCIVMQRRRPAEKQQYHGVYQRSWTTRPSPTTTLDITRPFCSLCTCRRSSRLVSWCRHGYQAHVLSSEKRRILNGNESRLV